MSVVRGEIRGEKSESLMPFSLAQPEYDLSTFGGRFMSLLKVQSPFNTFISRKTIEASIKMIDEQKELEANAKKNNSLVLLDPERIKELRKAQYVVQSSVHPDTNKILPPYQRFCAYTILNIPILFGMIITKQTTPNIIFWQWINQTYNATVNYANRNASSTLDMKGLLVAYAGAVTASISIGLGMRKLLSPYAKNIKGPAQFFFNFMINFTAIGCAGFLNVLIMRSKEIQEGIMLTDKEGNDVGKSQIIGKSAVLKTAASRVILPIPPLLLPTVAFYVMEKKNWVPKNKVGKLFIETAVFFGSLSFAPPLCCAVFEQTAKTDVSGLEQRFHNLTDSQGNPIRELYYNKGL